MASRKVIRNIVVDALFLALFFVFTFTPYVGYIQIIPGLLSVTTMHLLVLVGASLFSWKKATLYGFFFGISSLIKATMYPGAFDFFFVNPFVSILPRVLFGLISGLLFDFMKKRMTFKTFTISLPFVSLILTLLHTVLTLGCLYIFGVLDIFRITSLLDLGAIIEFINNEGYFSALGIATLYGALGEGAFSFVLIPLVFISLRHIPFIKNEDNSYKIESEKGDLENNNA